MDPTKVSNSIRGIGGTLAGALLLLAAIKGHPSSPDQATQLIDQVALLGGEVATGLGAAWTLYGLIMKGVMWVHDLLS